ncbi:MAG TPA: YlbF family regulator [Candidatus Limiplasma sp.]|nr:YlbF family regulator [Candidatus Limiplasma sp.]HRX09111.1 YlbF family regulator [Candidatus Limiplasma sp.]
MANYEIQTASAQLAAAIRKSDEYAVYKQIKDAVMADTTNKALIDEYQRLQTKLQMAAVTGADSTADDVQRFQQMSGLLMMNASISQYFMAQIRLQQMLSEVFQTITQAAELDIKLPGM